MAWFTACLCCLCLHSKMLILVFRTIKSSSCHVRWILTWTFACNLTAMLCTRHAEIGSCFLSQTRSDYIFIPTLLNKTLYPSVNSVCSVNNTTRQCKWEYKVCTCSSETFTKLSSDLFSALIKAMLEHSIADHIHTQTLDNVLESSRQRQMSCEHHNLTRFTRHSDCSAVNCHQWVW